MGPLFHTPSIRRAIFVTLTDAGRERHEQARRIQRAVLAEHLAEV
jgi:DNA-binding MarR family transcriptional regulator